VKTKCWNPALIPSEPEKLWIEVEPNEFWLNWSPIGALAAQVVLSRSKRGPTEHFSPIGEMFIRDGSVPLSAEF
jgi:hypothetical protein